MEDDGDFSSIIKQCVPTSSQEDVLRTCPWARDSEVFSDDDDDSSFGIPVASNGIVMASLPESSPEAFQTPPEHFLPSSSEKQRSPESGGEVSERTVGLGKYPDNQGLSGPNSTQVINGGGADRSRRGGECEGSEFEFEKLMFLQRKSRALCEIAFEQLSKKLKVSHEYLGVSDDNEDLIAETIHHEDCKTNTEVLELEVEEIGENMAEDQMFVDLLPRETDLGVAVGALSKEDEVDVGVAVGALSKEHEVPKHGNVSFARKNVEDFDKFKYVRPSGVNRKVAGGSGGQRELPPLISRQDKTMRGEAGQSISASRSHILNAILDALKLVGGEVDYGSDSEEDCDFLETAKKCGMTFPRPRWWPPEGYDD